jgi:hypothetical protein
MSIRLAVLADPADAELAGLTGEYLWGAAWTADVEQFTVEPGSEPDVIVTLRDATPPPGVGATRIAWMAGAGAEGPAPPDRVIAQGGPGLWRQAPWPVNDRVFELPAAAAGAGALICAGTERHKREIAERLEERGVPVAVAERLTLAGLRDSAVVVLAVESAEPLPAEALSVLAAGRVLVTARCRPSFGLQAGLDHHAAEPGHEAVGYADAAVKYPRAFERMRVWGRLAAERHRASVVYGGLVTDLALEAATAA